MYVNKWNLNSHNTILTCEMALPWRHNGREGVSNNQHHQCLLNRLFRRRSKKTSKLRVTGLCAGNSPVTGEFPAQMASNAENVSIWWRHHGLSFLSCVAEQYCQQIYKVVGEIICVSNYNSHIVVLIMRLYINSLAHRGWDINVTSEIVEHMFHHESSWTLLLKLLSGDCHGTLRC